MFKKLLLTAILFAVSFTFVSAQDFVLVADTMHKDTSGSAVTNPCADHSVFFYNYVKNNTGATLTEYKWKIIQKDFPFGWSLCQFCDNNLCRPGTDFSAPYADITAGSVNAGDSGLMEPAITVPADADNGVGILRVKIWTANTTDTATFIVNKTPTGISKIAVNDARVNVYPNPANNALLVYAEKSLNPANISIVSITGQTVYSTVFNTGKEAANVSISSLTKGTYMIRLTDNKGQLITARKFIKE
ncbi:T9SS type A sorting domain-containing protein [Taibaiella lutea]|uniref:T9SS type A sorting domain-containing protein n=1 Tax=Taibaiella lutea TaxID=2608001 RepID=A0A5M6CTT3_9BACT|nr:T9SS type A sorting domain-containing protein [Taibaiella lutea]KAA5536579.1 T9SS type A sorting domain-containing protein [Taibaiella lutea]